MTIEFMGFGCRITLEFIRLDSGPVLRRYRVVSRPACVRRRLYRNIRDRLRD